MPKKINSKRKGKTGELELAKIFREYGYEHCRRSQQYCGTESSADIVGLDYIHTECKRKESLSLYPAMQQAINDSGDSKDMPVVFHRRNGKQWLAIMNLDDFMKMYAEYFTNRRLEEMGVE